MFMKRIGFCLVVCTCIYMRAILHECVFEINSHDSHDYSVLISASKNSNTLPLAVERRPRQAKLLQLTVNTAPWFEQPVSHVQNQGTQLVFGLSGAD